MIAIYIESGDEITTVIERLRGVSEEQVALVAPKGAILLHSIVNLKLARKAAADAGKQMVVVTTDPIGKNLCAQLGIPLARTEEEAAHFLAGTGEADSSGEAKVIAGVRIHRYYEEEAGEESAAPAPDPIIIPKELLATAAATAAEPITVPDSVPEPPAPAHTEVRAATAVSVPPEEPIDAPITRRTLSADQGEEEGAQTTQAEPALKQPLNKRVMALIIFVGTLTCLAILAISFLFLPFTTVAVSVDATPWNRDLSYTASTAQTEASDGYATIPAEQLSAAAEGTGTVTATGTKQVGTAASGTAKLYNYDSTSAVTVPAGVTLTASGKSFTTTAAVSVPGFTQEGSGKPRVPGTASVAVTANAVGPDSNLTDGSASDLTVSGIVLSSITISSSGGTSTEVTIVTSADITAAKNALIKTLTEQAVAKLTEQLTNRTLLSKEGADLTELGSFTPSVTAGAEAAGGELKGSLTLRRTVINVPTLDTFSDARLRLDQKSDRSYAIAERTRSLESLSADGSTLTFTETVRGTETVLIPVGELPAVLAGKSISEGEALVRDRVPGAEVSTNQRPSWWPLERFPAMNRYIRIETKTK